jgi:hypothetical protein
MRRSRPFKAQPFSPEGGRSLVDGADGAGFEQGGFEVKSEEGRSDQPKVETIMTSAPGKVILFGEHAVVPPNKMTLPGALVIIVSTLG